HRLAFARAQSAADGVDAAVADAQVAVEFAAFVDQPGVDDQGVGHLGFRSGWGHGVVAAGVEGVAAADAPQRQPAALERTKPRDRGHRVLRATRHETAARAQQRAEQALVAAQEEDEQACDHDNWTARRAHWRVVAAMVLAGYNSTLSRLKGIKRNWTSWLRRKQRRRLPRLPARRPPQRLRPGSRR